jgi:two-component system, NtrC family, sensor kinase
MQRGVAIGAIHLRRIETQLFTDRQVALLQTFADQAVIAIENVRLFTEAQARNRALTESLEQQTATGEILRVISSSPTEVQPVFDTIAQSANRLCDAEFCAVLRFDGHLLHFVAHDGLSADAVEAARAAFPMAADGGSAGGRSILSAAVTHIPDVRADPEYRLGALARIATYRSMVAVPMIRDGMPIGTIVVQRAQVGHFPDRQIALLKTFADQAVIAIENVRLFQELEARNRDLAATLEQQTATSDILRIISSSPTGIEPTFDAIARSATALCDADSASVFRFDGELVHFVAQHGRTPEEIEVTRRAFPQPPRHHSPAGRAILAGTIIQIADVSQDPEVERSARIHRTVLSVPLIRDGRPLGVITLARRAVLPFTDKQIDLVKTFAEQAVIAIENVRLFKELEARNRDLT